MKTLTILSVLLTLFISFSSFIVSRQLVIEEKYQEQSVTNFKIHRQGKGTVLSWAPATNSVYFRIEHSLDGEFFEPLAELENTGERTIRFKHEDVFPGINYYRVIFIDASGMEEHSEVRSIRIVKHG